MKDKIKFKVGDKVTDLQGRDGIITDIKDIHNVEVQYTRRYTETGIGLYCLDENCSEFFDELKPYKSYRKVSKRAMKTKCTPELLKELGWKRNEHKDWIYPDDHTGYAWIKQGTEGKFKLKDIVRFMVREHNIRLVKNLVKNIQETPI